MLQTRFENEQLNSLPKTLTNNRSRSGFIATNRPDSAQLVDLHVYIIPKSVWKNVQNLAQNAAMDDAISVGFVRVPPEIKLHDLRESIERSCGAVIDFPRDFIFLRSVGRCLTRVKQTQEDELKVKHYRPPLTYASEIYLLEGRHEDYAYTPSDSPTVSSASYLFGNRHQGRLNLDDHGRSPSRFSNYQHRRPLHDEKKNLSKTNPNDLTFRLPSSSRQDWTKFTRNDSDEPSPKELFKLQEEQERLRRRQVELQQMRRAVEEKKLNSEREEEERRRRRRQEKAEAERRRLEQQTRAATKIQASYRGFKDRKEYRKLQRNIMKNDSRISSSKTNTSTKESIKNEDNMDINDDEFSDGQILSLSSSIESTSDVDSNSSETETRTIKKQDIESIHSNSSSALSQKTERKIQSDISSDSKIDETNNVNNENIRSATVTKTRCSEDEILPLATPDSDDDTYEIEYHETEIKRRQQLEEEKRKAKELKEQRRRKLAQQQHEDPESLRTRLQELKIHRIDLEKTHGEVIKNLKYMHSRITLRRRDARDMWKKKYFQEKKKTSSIEEQPTQLKTELDEINKKILDIIDKESKHSAQMGHVKLAEVGDFMLQVTRIQQEILDIRHQIDLAKLRLTTDIKLRNQAENECRTLKQELAQAKMNLKHMRNRIGV